MYHHEPHASPHEPHVPAEAKPVYVAAGANLGARAETLQSAFQALIELEQTWAWRSSALYETPPVAVAAAPGESVPAFLNAVFAARTTLSPQVLLAALQTIEWRAGRSDKGDHRSRTLDLDLLALGELVLAEAELSLPHPRLAERWFVLKPLCDLAPTWRHPQSGATAEAMLAALEAGSGEDETIGRGWHYADGVA